MWIRCPLVSLYGIWVEYYSTSSQIPSKCAGTVHWSAEPTAPLMQCERPGTHPTWGIGWVVTVPWQQMVHTYGYSFCLETDSLRYVSVYLKVLFFMMKMSLGKLRQETILCSWFLAQMNNKTGGVFRTCVVSVGYYFAIKLLKVYRSHRLLCLPDCKSFSLLL